METELPWHTFILALQSNIGQISVRWEYWVWKQLIIEDKDAPKEKKNSSSKRQLHRRSRSIISGISSSSFTSLPAV